MTLSELLSADVRFFVFRAGDYTIFGCGGYVLLPTPAAEMKRLVVAPMARGQDVGAFLVKPIENAALLEEV